MEADKVGALMGLAAGDVSSAQGMQASAQQQISSGISTTVSGVGTAAGGLAAGSGPDFANMTTEEFQTWLDSQ